MMATATRFTRSATPIEKEATGEELDVIDTNMLLSRLREAAAAAEAQLAAEAAAEVEQAEAAAAEIVRLGGLQQSAADSATPTLDALMDVVHDPQLQSAFDSLDCKIASAKQSVAEVARICEKAAAAGAFDTLDENDISIPSHFWRSEEERLSAVTDKLLSTGHIDIKLPKAVLDGSDEAGIISSYVSSVTGRKSRELAAKGGFNGLASIERERNEWAPYLTLSSWDGADANGCTALILAAQHGHLDCVQGLIEWGASVFEATKDGATALHLAKTREIASLLLRSGADPAALDSRNRTPWMVTKAAHLQPGGRTAMVMEAFLPHQQKVYSKAGKMQRLSREELKAAALAWRAAEQTAARERADSLYHQGTGAMALGEYDEASAALSACLEMMRGFEWELSSQELAAQSKLEEALAMLQLEERKITADESLDRLCSL